MLRTMSKHINTIQYDTIRYDTIRYDTIQYNTSSFISNIEHNNITTYFIEENVFNVQ